MSNIEEVKEKIKQGKLDEAMAMAMIEAMKLEIVTTNSNPDNPSSCRTFINVLENEIKHELGDSSLENFHFSEVEKAHSKILQNVQSVKNMFTLLQENVEKLSE